MKLNKKLIVVMMALIMGSSLSGCGQQNEVIEEEIITEPPVAGENAANDNNGTVNNNTNGTTNGNTNGNTNGTTNGNINNNTNGNMNNNGEGNIGEQDPTVASETLFIITDGLELPNQMPMDETFFNDAYGIDTNLLESYAIHMPMMNVKANECAVFELKDAKDADKILEGIARRQTALEEQWKSYLPDQYELVQNGKTAVNGKLVLFVIDDQADTIVGRFNELEVK